MKGKLSSNELIADFDYSAINEDYSFFRVETEFITFHFFITKSIDPLTQPELR